MAKFTQIEALISSHHARDEGRFRAIALQIAAGYAKKGQGAASKRIKDQTERREGNSSLPKELSGLLHTTNPSGQLSDLILSEETQEDLELIFSEHAIIDKLRSHGLDPIRKVLLTGPPGTGKTVTASIVANTLNLPLYRIKLHGLITKHLGESAAKMGLIFDFIRDHKAVYLFDEFDAIGASRNSNNDVAEMRRVLNSFLVFMEDDHSESLIFAAANLPQLIDNALFRRFDIRIQYFLPTEINIADLISTTLNGFKAEASLESIPMEASTGLSHSDVISCCKRAIKDSIIKGIDVVQTSDLLSALSARKRFNK